MPRDPFCQIAAKAARPTRIESTAQGRARRRRSPAPASSPGSRSGRSGSRPPPRPRQKWRGCATRWRGWTRAPTGRERKTFGPSVNLPGWSLSGRRTGRAANSQLETTAGREFQGLRAITNQSMDTAMAAPLPVNYPCKLIISCRLKLVQLSSTSRRSGCRICRRRDCPAGHGEPPTKRETAGVSRKRCRMISTPGPCCRRSRRDAVAPIRSFRDHHMAQSAYVRGAGGKPIRASVQYE